MKKIMDNFKKFLTEEKTRKEEAKKEKERNFVTTEFSMERFFLLAL